MQANSGTKKTNFFPNVDKSAALSVILVCLFQGGYCLILLMPFVFVLFYFWDMFVLFCGCHVCLSPFFQDLFVLSCSKRHSRYCVGSKISFGVSPLALSDLRSLFHVISNVCCGVFILNSCLSRVKNDVRLKSLPFEYFGIAFERIRSLLV